MGAVVVGHKQNSGPSDSALRSLRVPQRSLSWPATLCTWSRCSQSTCNHGTHPLPRRRCKSVDMGRCRATTGVLLS